MNKDAVIYLQKGEWCLSVMYWLKDSLISLIV